MRKLARRSLPLAILLLGVGAFLALKASRPESAPVKIREKSWIVAVEQAIPGLHTPVLTLYGRVDSPRLTRLSAAISADVQAVNVFEGEPVKVGEILVTLDDRESVLLLQEREAEVAEIRAQIESENARHQTDLESLEHEETLLKLTLRGVERARDLARTQVGSEARLDEAREAEKRQRLALESRKLALREHRHRLAQLQAKLARAQALRDRAALDVARSRIAAPFEGRVTKVSVSPGDRVRVGDRLLSLFDAATVEVRAQIPSRYLPVVQEALVNGPPLVAESDVDERRVIAMLDRMSSQVEPGTGGVDGIFRITQGREWIQIGRTLELKLSLPREPNTVPLPLEAVYGTDRIYRLADDRMQALTVQRVGEARSLNGDTRVLVRSPELRAGDAIVVTQLPNAMDGLRVRAVESNSEPALWNGDTRDRDKTYPTSTKGR